MEALFEGLTTSKHSTAIILGLFFVLVKVKYLISRKKSLWTDKVLSHFQNMIYNGVSDFTEYWHEYDLHYPPSMKSHRDFPKSTLLVGYHSRTTIDLVYLVFKLQLRVVVYYLMFKVPPVAAFLREMGSMPSSAGNTDKDRDDFAIAMANTDRPVVLLPGGVHEMTKAYDDMYKVQWKDEPGFARVIVDYNAKLKPGEKGLCAVPFFTRNCEKLFASNKWWYDNSGKWFRHISKLIKQGHIYLVPLQLTLIFFQMGFCVFPIPVKLDTYFGEPLYPVENETAEAFASRVKESLQQMITSTQMGPEISFTRHKNSPIRTLLVIVLVILQNASGTIIMVISVWIVLPLALIAYGLSKLFIGEKKMKNKNKEKNN